MEAPLSTLFLHGGPGLSAIAERDLYGHTLPIHWWDQPRSVVLFSHPFEALVEAAEDEVRMLAESQGHPADVIAHSFGAHLALHLVARAPQHVRKLWLLAPVYDIGAAFVRLGTRLLEIAPTSGPLLAALEEFKAGSDHVRFSRLASQVTSFANFFDLYWSPTADARRRWYLDLVAHQNVVDPRAFEVIVQDFWAAQQPSSPLPTEPASVQIVFGRLDPLIDIDTERKTWMQYFPRAQCAELDAGHFIHLEDAAAHWWNRN
ncbi:alpha/beta fold hydrolase [Paraburkholderia flagellata]|uniref:alpha/beta fold hydrolase n=1 Tax=Paraburkholderia flagellata TaxID=2883241 RepID=UPI001F2E55A4|nr:alpha/beta hydrolase [Paraburkholderia flagellata]